MTPATACDEYDPIDAIGRIRSGTLVATASGIARSRSAAPNRPV